MPKPVKRLIVGDCLEEMARLPDSSVDLVFTSPPYEDARTYGISFNLKGQDWVDWCIPRFFECLRVCKGLVAWVVGSRTKNYRWSATSSLLTADLHRAGVNLREPPIYHRSGIPGSGGPDWLRRDYEWIICATEAGGKLPWSDNTACGHEPKCKPGGDPTYRLQDGRRVRVTEGEDGNNGRSQGKAVKQGTNRGLNRLCETKSVGCEAVEYQPYMPPKLANPGNVIKCSGGHLGSKLAHETEAPFPEKLAEFFIKSFCPPGGTVLDPFAGSGTTLAVAEKNGRKWLGMDVRESQIALIKRRFAQEVLPEASNIP